MDEKEREELLKAIEKYTEKIEEEPNNHFYYSSRGNIYYILEDYRKALEDFSQAIELAPNNDSYFNNRGASYFNLKEYKKALENCNKAIELAPNELLFYINCGKIYCKLKKYEEAIKKYEEAIELTASCRDDEELKEINLISKEAEELKEITINYLNNNYKKTKKLINSYEKEYAKNIKKSQITISFEEFNLNKDFLENIKEESEGYLTFADILGWKGIWRKQNTKEEKVDTLNTLLFIKNKLEEEFKDKKESYKINLISDTYVIYAKEQELSNKLSKRLIELCLENDLLIRGATSYGKFYNNDMVYIGQAVDDAASWHEKGEEIGIFYTPSARLNEKISNSKLEEIFLINGEVNTKNGKIETFFVNWYSEENKKNFYNIMKNEIITPDISLKYFNTEKKLNKYVKDEVDCIEEEKE